MRLAEAAAGRPTVPGARRRLLWTAPAGLGLLALHLNRVSSSDAAVELNERAAGAGEVVHVAVEVVSELGLLALATAVLVLAWRVRPDPRRFATVVSGGIGTIAAYVGSEALKVAHAQARPCQALAAIDPLGTCPPVGDWSLPSNHAVLAAALATVVVLTAPRLWRFVVPLAAAVAASRVALGVHYPHDVNDGLLLGAGVVVLTVVATRRPVARLVRAAGSWPVLRRWLPPDPRLDA